ncbi:DUF1449 family protein [Chitinophagales bacterium]|nr:DUF1449 family protein [Chitinophagales bacterium]
MIEFLQLLSTPVNLGLSVLLGLCLLYWILVILGGLGADFLDFDFDMDGDIDLDLDVDSELSADGFGSNFFGLLHFFNFGALPMMLIFSVLFLSMWTIALLGSDLLGTNTVITVLALIPNFILSLFITKYLTLPLVKPFNKLSKSAEPINYIGKTCKITLAVRDGKMGEAELTANDVLLNITVRGIDGQTFIKGESAIIIEKEADKKVFLIEKT